MKNCEPALLQEYAEMLSSSGDKVCWEVRFSVVPNDTPGRTGQRRFSQESETNLLISRPRIDGRDNRSQLDPVAVLMGFEYKVVGCLQNRDISDQYIGRNLQSLPVEDTNQGLARHRDLANLTETLCND